jgi:hypothetical protein
MEKDIQMSFPARWEASPIPSKIGLRRFFQASFHSSAARPSVAKNLRNKINIHRKNTDIAKGGIAPALAVMPTIVRLTF